MEMNQSLPGSAPAPRVLDLGSALRRLRGDRQLLLDLISFFLEDYPQVSDEIHRAAEQQNGEDLCLAAHSLKGLAANFDAHEVVEFAGAIEQHAKAGDLASAAQLVPALDVALNRLTADLCNYREAQHK